MCLIGLGWNLCDPIARLGPFGQIYTHLRGKYASQAGPDHISIRPKIQTRVQFIGLKSEPNMGLALLGWDCRFKIISELDEFYTCRNINMGTFIRNAYLLLNAINFFIYLRSIWRFGLDSGPLSWTLLCNQVGSRPMWQCNLDWSNPSSPKIWVLESTGQLTPNLMKLDLISKTPGMVEV